MFNSHNKYKNNKIIKKIKIELAIKAKNSLMQKLFLRFLNNENVNVRKI